MRKYLAMLFLCVMVLSCLFGRTLVIANAKESDAEYIKCYTNIEIQQGDTLWSIAKTYNKHSELEIREYIRVLKQMNGMVTDRIAAGDSLMIVYFKEKS